MEPPRALSHDAADPARVGAQLCRSRKARNRSTLVLEIPAESG
jgi:hypothetical protein